MFKRNEEIRIAKGKIPTWVIAERLGIHENTLYHIMRKKLPEVEKQRILAAIHEIQTEMKLEGK